MARLVGTRGLGDESGATLVRLWLTSDQQLQHPLNHVLSCSRTNGTSPDAFGRIVQYSWPNLYQSVPPAVLRRLMRELNELRTNPPDGIRVVVNEDNMLDVTGIVEGPGACL